MKKYLISGFNTVQDVKLEAGTYTLVAYVKSMHGDVYTFALGDGTDWEEFSIDVIQGQLCKVWLTFTIDKKVTKFKPIANNFTEELPVYVADLQLTRGNIPVESGASPFDIDQILNDLHDEIDAIEDFAEGAFKDGLLVEAEKMQLKASLDSIGSIVRSVEGSYNKLLNNPFIHEDTMDAITLAYEAFMVAWINSDFDPKNPIVEDSEGNRIDMGGLKDIIDWIVKGDHIVDENERAEKDRALNAFNLALYEYNQAEKEVYNDVGENSIAPIIDENGMWAFWSTELQEFIPSDFSAEGDDGHSPYIDVLTGTWWEWNPEIGKFKDTFIKAEGDKGETGRGVISIIKQFYLSDSKTDQIGSTWKDEPDEWVNDKFMWTRSKITYSSGTPNPSYTEPLVNIEWVAAKAIPYQAGEYKAGVSYIRYPNSYPIVSYGTSGGVPLYYALKGDVGTNKQPNLPANKDIWESVPSFKQIFTEVLFAEFAKLDSFVFNGGRMFSQQGNMQDYTDANFIPNIYLDGEEGNAKMGALLVNADGVLYTEDANGVTKLKINVENIPTLESLLLNTFESDVVSNIKKTGISTVYNLPNTVTIPFDGTEVTFEAMLELSASIEGFLLDGATPEKVNMYARVDLYQGSTQRYYIGSASHISFQDIDDKQINESFVLNNTISSIAQGTYTIRVTTSYYAPVVMAQWLISESNLYWNFNAGDVRRFEIGINGLMFFFANNHFYITEDGTFDLRGKTNMPGVLASGTISTGGGLSNEWGAKINYGQTITGGYKIFLKDMTHNKYSVQVTPHTNVTFRVGTKTSTYFEILGTGAADFVVFGSNY